jgi:hypothetical protein
MRAQPSREAAHLRNDLSRSRRLRLHAAGKINTKLPRSTPGRRKLVDERKLAGTLAALQTVHASGYEQLFIPRDEPAIKPRFIPYTPY